jgi:hypothetical protein
LKNCTTCNQEKENSEFYVRKNGTLYTECKQCKNARGRNRYDKNPEEHKKLTSKYYKENGEQVRAKNKEWRENNPEKRRALGRKHNNKYRKTVEGNIHDRMRRSINDCLRSGKNGRSWESLVGYTLHDLKEHLESQFNNVYSWDNRHLWHIDHIIPKKYFNIIDENCDDFKQCWSLNNLQPLWAKDNISKCDKLPDGSLARYKIG